MSFTKKKGQEPKDKIYVLTSDITPLQFLLRNRHKAEAPLQYYDESKNMSRSLRYATNQTSIFEDEQNGDVLIGTIIFQNGKLEVPKTNPTLQAFLDLHPSNGTLFVEHNPEVEAQAEVDVMLEKAEAMKVAFDMEADELENVAMAKWGSKVTRMKTSEIKRDILIFAQDEPATFLKLASDDTAKLKGMAVRAVEAGLLSLKDHTFYNGTETICKVPFDEVDPYNTLARWLKTKEGLKFQDFINAKLK